MPVNHKAEVNREVAVSTSPTTTSYEGEAVSTSFNPCAHSSALPLRLRTLSSRHGRCRRLRVQCSRALAISQHSIT